MDSQDSKQMARLACNALSDKQAKDITVLDICQVSVVADYFIIATVTNQRQMQAVMDQIEEFLGKAGYPPKHIEGERGSNWILMDFGDVIIHLFDEENRLFYDLERIWRDGTKIDPKDLEEE